MIYRKKVSVEIKVIIESIKMEDIKRNKRTCTPFCLHFFLLSYPIPSSRSLKF